MKFLLQRYIRPIFPLLRDMGRGDDFDDTDAKKWSKFDGLFGVFIVLNAIVLGLEVDNPDIPFYQKPGTLFYENRDIYWWLEQIFLLLFITELCLRIALQTDRSKCWKSSGVTFCRKIDVVVEKIH